MRRALFVYFIIKVGGGLSIMAQSGDNAPVIYDQFFKNFFLVNPANSDFGNKDLMKVSIGNRTLTGLFQGVNRNYIDLNFSLNGEKYASLRNTRRFHHIGAMLLNAKDGDYFQRNRVYLRYSWQMALNRKASISFGASAGFVNFNILASQASGGSSYYSPDANVGIWYLRKNFQLGFSFQQMFPNSSKPIIGQTIPLVNYFNLNANYKAQIGPTSYLTSYAYIKYQTAQPFYSELASILTFYRIFEVGANYRYSQGVAFMVGLTSITIGTGHVRLMASYLVSTTNITNVNQNVLEFSLGYSMVRK